mgnify:CR=1 FL=1
MVAKRPTERYFLVVRDNEVGRTTLVEFAGSSRDEAFEAYFAAERKYDAVEQSSEHADHEVVLIVADSREAVKRGYPQYFLEGDRAARQKQFIATVGDLAHA